MSCRYGRMAWEVVILYFTMTLLQIVYKVCCFPPALQSSGSPHHQLTLYFTAAAHAHFTSNPAFTFTPAITQRMHAPLYPAY